MKITFILASLFMATTATNWGVTEIKDLDLESAKKERAANARLNFIHCYLDIVPGEIPPTPRGEGPNFKPLRLIDQTAPNTALKTETEASQTLKPVVIEPPKEDVQKANLQSTPIVTISEPVIEIQKSQPMEIDSGVKPNVALGSDLSKPEAQLQIEPVIDTTIKAQPNLEEGSKITATDLAQHLVEEQLKKEVVNAALIQDDTTLTHKEDPVIVSGEQQNPIIVGGEQENPIIVAGGQENKIVQDGDGIRFRARRILANTAPFTWAVRCFDSSGIGKPVTIKTCRKDSIDLIYTDKYGDKNSGWSKSVSLPLEKGIRYQNDILWPFFTDSSVTDNSLTFTDCTITFKKSSILGVIAILFAAFVL